ncbi:spermatogenesis-associated protein 32 [Hippopotamus amphibius kiboko]|uniref:spermatogenesis-associated protein 32 n=1 Tax=Hippopotamus amphibius kiboko TaxID=575201 RepID=UPI00259A7684|nr:spermatogenesis-associated protein 32 [Hippopotamus amphibius kiboko]
MRGTGQGMGEREDFEGPQLSVKTFQLEKEFLELEPLDEEFLSLDPELELEWKPKPLPPPETHPVVMPKPKAKLDMEPLSEDPEPQEHKIESLYPSAEGLTQQDISQWSMRSSSTSSTEVDPLSTDRRSIRVQTSKHLFWADKLIQASEHSLKQVISMQPVEQSTKETTRHPDPLSVPKDTVCSRKQGQDPSAQAALPDKVSQQPPSRQPSPTPQTIGLAELVNFASSLAMASSSRMDLPSLEHVIKASPQKATAPSTEPAVDHAAQPTVDTPEQENLTKDVLEQPPREPLEARGPQNASQQEGRLFLLPYLDFSKPGFKSAAIKGEVKFLQPPNMSSQPQGAGRE